MPSKESAVVRVEIRDKRKRIAFALVGATIKILRRPSLVVPVANVILRLWRMDVLANGKPISRYRIRVAYDQETNSLTAVDGR